MTLKRVYLVHRNPALRHHELAPRWKQHAELAQTFPELVYLYPRLKYNCTLEQDPGIPGASRAYDGVGMLWLRSDDLASQQPTDPRMRPTMQEDELKVFRARMLEAMVTVDERVLKDGRGARFGVISFLRALPGLAPEAFQAAWSRQAQAVVVSPELGGAIQRYVVAPTIGKPTFECGGVSEMWFDSAEAAVQACNTATYRRLVLEAQSEFARAEPLTLVTEIGYAWSAGDDPHSKPFP